MQGAPPEMKFQLLLRKEAIQRNLRILMSTISMNLLTT